MDDADFMLMLKNYEETRQFAIASHGLISRESHIDWLRYNVQEFQVIEDVEKSLSRPPEEREKIVSVGVIRIHDNEISIWVDKKFWNLGIATYILQHVSQRGMTAKIVCPNIASMKAFIRAGFEPTSYTPENRKDEWSEMTPAYYIFKKY